MSLTSEQRRVLRTPNPVSRRRSLLSSLSLAGRGLGVISRAVGVSGRSVSRGPVTPDIVEGHAIAWYDAQKIDTVVTSKGEVIGWKDKTEEEHDVTGSVTGYTSDGINGRASLLFDDDNDDNLRLSEWNNGTKPQPNTIFAVVQTNDKHKGEQVIHDGSDDNEDRNQLELNEGGDNSPTGIWANDWVLGDPPGLKPILYTSIFDGSDSLIRENGSQTGSGDAGLQGIYGITLGSRPVDDRFFTGHMGEIIVVEKRPESSEINAVESYLSEKWGIAI